MATIKRKRRYIDEVFITDYEESCHLATFGAASDKFLSVRHLNVCN